jgi:hypothetical protein
LVRMTIDIARHSFGYRVLLELLRETAATGFFVTCPPAV